MEACDELLERDERLGGTFMFDESNEIEEEEETYEPPSYDTTLVLRTFHTQAVQVDSDQRDKIFHTKCLVMNKGCSVILDGGSCTNVASSEMVFVTAGSWYAFKL